MKTVAWVTFGIVALAFIYAIAWQQFSHCNAGIVVCFEQNSAVSAVTNTVDSLWRRITSKPAPSAAPAQGVATTSSSSSQNIIEGNPAVPLSPGTIGAQPGAGKPPLGMPPGTIPQNYNQTVSDAQQQLQKFEEQSSTQTPGQNQSSGPATSLETDISKLNLMQTQFQKNVSSLASSVHPRVDPCSAPIAFSIGDIDARFGMSKEAFSGIADEAVALWEKATGRTLFTHVPTGSIVLRAVYDARQLAKQKLQEFLLKTSQEKTSIDTMTQNIATMTATAQKNLDANNAAYAVYTHDRNLFEIKVAKANQSGGGETQDLINERNVLNQRLLTLQANSNAVDALDGQINALSITRNALVQQYNIDITRASNIKASLGQDFSQQVTYVQSEGDERIDVFAFDNADDLRDALTHALGLALGLTNSADAKSVMYKAHTTSPVSVSPSDVLAVQKLCGGS